MEQDTDQFEVQAAEWGGLRISELGIAEWEGGHARLEYSEAIVLSAILRAAGKPVSMGRMLIIMYGRDPDGGPLSAEQGVTVRMSRIRTKIQHSPVGIGVRYRIGYYAFLRKNADAGDYFLPGKKRRSP